MFVGASFIACSNEKDLYDPNYDVQSFVSKYQEAFIKTYGQPAANQTWGFGDAAASRVTRSQSAPECANIAASYDEAWVATYNETAKEPNSKNVLTTSTTVYIMREHPERQHTRGSGML